MQSSSFGVCWCVVICPNLAAQLALLLLLPAYPAAAVHAVQYPPIDLLLSSCLVFIMLSEICTTAAAAAVLKLAEKSCSNCMGGNQLVFWGAL